LIPDNPGDLGSSMGLSYFETNPHPGDPPKPWDVLSKIDYFISETWGFKNQEPIQMISN